MILDWMEKSGTSVTLFQVGILLSPFTLGDKESCRKRENYCSDCTETERER